MQLGLPAVSAGQAEQPLKVILCPGPQCPTVCPGTESLDWASARPRAIGLAPQRRDGPARIHPALLSNTSGLTVFGGRPPASTSATALVARLGHRQAGRERGAADVGHEHGPRSGEKSRVDMRLVLIDVEPGGEQPPGLERVRASASSSTTGPRAVLTRTAVGFMSASLRASMRWSRLGRERHVQADHVGLPEEVVEVVHVTGHARLARGRDGSPASRIPRRAGRRPCAMRP